MKVNYVTISREYGSGGREIGKKLSEKLGIPCYDKEIIEETAFKTGFAEEYVKKQGEYANARNWLEYSFSSRNSYGMSPEDYLWAKQREVILDLVKKGPCVIVGRCADYILRDRTDVLNVFIHADYEYRRHRITDIYKDPEHTEKMLNDIDKKRKFNYKYYTEQEWGKSQNYDLTLSSSALGLDQCVDLIYGVVEKGLER
ncbi:MAG: cytidylate kinase-like family protein [Oribacterium sp.]|jgi:cytidylate kinase|nr:cytidylate kinase-like family protein [Oribacterium sp.]MDY6306670.1 cytidylate kinase-like family protein [Oribacterium sp.]MDY6316712.1 cytidylate kinase-like family protein [Oribacterium sp.]